MIGEQVIIKYQGQVTDTDPFGAEKHEELTISVDNVLVAPGDATNDLDSNRPDGVEIRYTLQFPKEFIYQLEDTSIFRGAYITVRDNDYKVIGQPDFYDEVNCPTDWCMTVKVVDVDG